MDIKRLGLTLAMAIVGVMLWTQWQHDYPATKQGQAVTTTAQSTTRSNSGDFVPPPASAPQNGTPKNTPVVASKSQSTGNNARYIVVDTDVLHVRISNQGGNIILARLPHFPVSLQEKNNPMTILSSAANQYYVLKSGVTSQSNTKPLVFRSRMSKYSLQSGKKDLVVSLVANNGITKVIKTFHFYRGKYNVTLDTSVENVSQKNWSGSFYHQISRKQPDHHYTSMAYNGGAISSTSIPYQKIKYKDMLEKNLNQSTRGGWVAMQQHYFLSAWIPNQYHTHHFYSGVSSGSTTASSQIFNLGFTSGLVSLAPGKTKENTTSFYIGPENMKALSALAPGLNLTVDYGILSPISMAIFWCMQTIHHFVGNWGWAIILVTILIKLILFWPSAMSYRSMARMKMMAPRIKSLQERHKDDKQALSKATMDLYKNEKVNPMGGCLPMLVQIPIFIALYWVLIESVQLRQSPFIFWIHDLSVKDPFYILPILMGGSMFLQQKLSPAPTDPNMEKMQYIMPVVFTVFFMHFPAGLVLYWLTNNLVSVAQQSYILKTYDAKADDVKRRKKKKR